jgi:hypothetical protein
MLAIFLPVAQQPKLGFSEGGISLSQIRCLHYTKQTQ